MKVLLINSVCGQGSTGRICTGIANLLKSDGYEAYIAYGLGHSDYPGSFNISSGKCDYLFHNVLSRLTDSEGLHSIKATRKLIKQIEFIKPDIVHIHTLHGHYINYKVLINYLNNINVKIVMTLHDCWTFTGHCAHFDMFDCFKWQSECKNCQYLSTYPQSLFIDRSRMNFDLKKQLFTQLGEKLVIVPVSYWLEELVRKSFLKHQNIYTIHNGIDINRFSPVYNKSISDKYNLDGKKIVLGVALPWSRYKGLPDFHKLRSMLCEDYAIIMVGLSEEQISTLPSGIIGFGKTDSLDELVELYSLADVFVNTTYCDNYPTVNLEAMACGTPVITYKTGGSPEAITGETGMVVEQGNVEKLVGAIQKVCAGFKENYRKACRHRAENNFDATKCFMNYIDLYVDLLNYKSNL